MRHRTAPARRCRPTQLRGRDCRRSTRQPRPAAARPRRRPWPAMARAGVLLALGRPRGWYYWNHWRPGADGQDRSRFRRRRAAGGAGWRPARRAGRAGRRWRAPVRRRIPRTPVVAVAAQIGDVPIVLDALGTVMPTQTVSVQSRVEGQLQRVLFEEGQLVKEGQLLAEIDPRRLQVQLTQAEGPAGARPRAARERALDLERYRTLFEQDSIAKQQVDTQRALVRQYEGLTRSTKARSTTPGCSSPMPASPRRSAGGSGCARSMRATWCAAPRRTAWW